MSEWEIREIETIIEDLNLKSDDISKVISELFAESDILNPMKQADNLKDFKDFMDDCRRLSNNLDKCNYCEFRFKCYTKEYNDVKTSTRPSSKKKKR